MSASFDPGGIAAGAHHLVGGKEVTGSGEEIPVRRPSDHAVIAVAHDAGSNLVDEAVRAADGAWRGTGWARCHPLDRARVLHRWASLVEERADAFARLESATSTRPIAETSVRDAVRAAGALRYFAEWADKIEGSVIGTGPGDTCLVTAEPYGVVGSITAWNFPLINAVWKSAPALAAGNAVVLKPSELTPSSALLLAETALEAGLPAGLFNVVQGYGATTGAALVRHPLVRKVTFTGSSATGRRIMADAAEAGTKPLTLELGGKSPQLVLADVRDLGRVAAHVAAGFLANSGQVCTAGSRLVVPRSMTDELVERVMRLAADRRAGPTWDERTTLPPIVSEKQAQRIEALLQASVEHGARVLTGGRRVPGMNAGVWMQPTILADVDEDSPGFREEFFGPVLSVHPYDDEEEGIALAGHPVYALAASVYTDDARKAQSVPPRIEAGTVWVNTHGRQPGFGHPQGGFNGSGFGKEMGRLGVEGFLRRKTVWHAHG